MMDDPEALRLTLERGRFGIPASASIDNVRCIGLGKVSEESCHNRIDHSRRHPVVIFMHGCSGALTPGDFFVDLAVTVMPNSFARPNRPIANCDIGANKGDVMPLRLAEARNAIAWLKRMPWVDTSKIYLAGFSEGGMTAALHAGEERLAGRIILGWTCASVDPHLAGLKGPPVPILAVVGSGDKYAQRPFNINRNCGEYFGGRANSESVVIKDGPHDILRFPETRDAIRRFINNVNVLPR